MRSVFIITSRNGKKGQFDILYEISENVTLVQLMDSVGNGNHAVGIVWYCIFESNYKKLLPLKLYSLNLIFFPSVVEVTIVMFESVFHEVVYINNTGTLKITEQWIKDWHEEIKVEMNEIMG